MSYWTSYSRSDSFKVARIRLCTLPLSCWPPAGYRVLVASTADTGGHWGLSHAGVWRVTEPCECYEFWVAGGWRWDTETGKGQALAAVCGALPALHLQGSAQYNDHQNCQFNQGKVKIKDLLITVSLHKIELSITATNLCITEGCTNRNQPKSYKSV